MFANELISYSYNAALLSRLFLPECLTHVQYHSFINMMYKHDKMQRLLNSSPLRENEFSGLCKMLSKFDEKIKKKENFLLYAIFFQRGTFSEKTFFPTRLCKVFAFQEEIKIQRDRFVFQLIFAV